MDKAINRVYLACVRGSVSSAKARSSKYACSIFNATLYLQDLDLKVNFK